MNPDHPNRRQSERLHDLKPTDIRLKGRLLRLFDISHEGIGVALEKDGPRFFIGERLEDIPIPMESGIVTVSGIVSHISVTAAGTILGIRFLYKGDEFRTIVQFKKERVRYSGETGAN